MRLHCFQHVPFEDLGSIAGWARLHEHTVTYTRFHAGERPPPVSQYDALIILGGPMSVHDEGLYPWLREEKDAIHGVLHGAKPILGICLGAQLLAESLGATVTPNTHKEIGWFPVFREGGEGGPPVVSCFPEQLDVFHWHGETYTMPPGAYHFASSMACRNQGFVYRESVVGLQFHLETTPDSAQNLIQACGHELAPGPFIQRAAVIMTDKARFRRVNRVMDNLLSQLLQ